VGIGQASWITCPELQRSIVEAAVTKQHSDGGFSLSDCVGGWKRHDNTPLDSPPMAMPLV
jgi:hypothetical protein